MRFWDVMLVFAFGLMLAGMFLPWWSLNATDFFGDLGLSRSASGLLGLSTGVEGWGAPLSGLGVTALVLNGLAIGFAALKLSLSPRMPLPGWYKEGAVITVIGSICTLFGIIVCLAAPSGGLAMWRWRPGSALVLAGGVLALVAGVMMAKGRSGAYQAPPVPPRPSEPRSASTAVSCASCGAMLVPGASYCSACGRRV